MFFQILKQKVIIILNSKFSNVFCDVPSNRQYGFQDPATSYFEGMIDLHHDLMFFMVLVTVFICYLLFSLVFNFDNKFNKQPPVDLQANSLIEIIWTMVPGLIILSLALPTFALIYSMEEILSPTITVRVVGNQWYWTYEHCDYLKKGVRYSLQFSSNMLSDKTVASTKGKALRLLSTDNILVLPSKVLIRFNVTSHDVIHSWAVPSFGIKLDGTPGRTNSATFSIKRNGMFYGQCSEICGVLHGFMPIQVKVVSPREFLLCVSAAIEKDLLSKTSAVVK
jgi:cytochrome c oxidase subunit 2